MRGLRKLLLPFSLLYGGILRFRHFLYDRGIIPSYRPHQRTIAVGNLELGGTGKTPMIDHLVNLLGENKTATLSRGYGRKTRGTRVVEPDMTALQCGDEPLLLKKRHPNLLVIVDENRRRGLEFLRTHHPDVEVVLLDDAFQHRRVRAHFYLLLTNWQRPFYDDHLLPAGDLRDLPSRARCADAVVVSKGPPQASPSDLEKKRKAISRYRPRHVFFSSLTYLSPRVLRSQKDGALTPDDRVVLLSGIARPEIFEAKAAETFRVEKHFAFRDHHPYTENDLFRLRDFIDTFDGRKPVVLTTEKDAARLDAHLGWFAKNEIDLWFWPIELNFGNRSDEFEALIKQHAKQA